MQKMGIICKMKSFRGVDAGLDNFFSSGAWSFVSLK